MKAYAVADGVSRASGDVLVIHDADVWCDRTPDAVDGVAKGRAWSVPHHRVRRLTPELTDAVIGGADPAQIPTNRLLEPPYVAHVGGGIVVMRRDIYGQVPLDPRFRNWGHEDDAWAMALNVLVGTPLRMRGQLWHFWHPPQERISRKRGSHENQALLRRYEHARTGHEMAALIAEFAQEAQSCR